MLMTARRAQPFAEQAATSPSIVPSHPQLDKRHADLSFSIDTRGRPFFRVLVAKDRNLFQASRQAERNAGNFYDSIREGMLPFDGAPTFYLVPRAALSAMMPAQALYFTLIAYEDREATRAAYSHSPEELASQAPSISIASDFQVASLASMFGTPVSQLFRVGVAASFDAGDEVGEDFAADAQDIGLDAGEDEAEDRGELEHAAAFDVDSLYGEAPVHAAAADGYDDGYDAPEDTAQADAFANEEGLRPAVIEDTDDGAGHSAASQSFAADDYDDGYETPVESPQGFGEDNEDDGAQDPPGDASSYGAYDDGFGGALDAREPVPDQLPDEDADPQGSAQGHSDDDADGVEIESQSQAYGDEFASSYGASALADTPRSAFDIDACKAVLARIVPFESGTEGFSRINADGEFAGRYGAAHPAHQRYHLGLGFGAFPFAQEHGTLGQLLTLMNERDGAAFARIFGSDSVALLKLTTTSEGPRSWESPDGLSPRLKSLGGAALWQEPWLSRFREAGRHPPFQGAQNELAARLYVQPMLPLAAKLGLDSDQALTLVVDRAVQMGTQAASQWIVDAVSPIQSPAQRQQALDRLQHADLRAFQRAKNLPPTGEWDTATHLELLAALRTRADSPLPIPSREQMLDAMSRRAEGSPWADRLFQL